jgi:hypothetical protein
MDASDGRRDAGCFFLDSLSPKGGTILAAVIADILADGLNSDQIASLGGFITIIGDALGYISAQMELNDSK